MTNSQNSSMSIKSQLVKFWGSDLGILIMLLSFVVNAISTAFTVQALNLNKQNFSRIGAAFGFFALYNLITLAIESLLAICCKKAKNHPTTQDIPTVDQHTTEQQLTKDAFSNMISEGQPSLLAQYELKPQIIISNPGVPSTEANRIGLR